MDHLIPSEAQLGDALRAHLAARGMTLRDAEVELGISKATLSRACRGHRIWSTHYIHLVKKIWFAPLRQPPGFDWAAFAEMRKTSGGYGE